MNYLDMFSGIGGFRLGIEKVHSLLEGNGRKNLRSSRRQKTINGTGNGNLQKNSRIGNADIGSPCVCIGHSEINRHADSIYQYHWRNSKNYGDATRIDPEELPALDLIVGGFPCQAFSISGERKGFEDTRGTLFFEVCRIAKVKRPKYLVLENVKGLLNHAGGQTFQTILFSLEELGYDVEWAVLNSKYFGVPQHRERIYIIGHLGGSGRKVFRFGENGKEIDGICGQATNTITQRYGMAKGSGSYIIENQFPENRLKKLIDGGMQGYYVYSADGVAQTQISRGGGIGKTTGLYNLDGRIRRLTPKECERLQGFPDDWTKHGIKNNEEYKVSDSQRYFTLGNAVTVNVVQWVMEQLFEVNNDTPCSA